MAPYLKVAGFVFGKKHLQAVPYWVPSVIAYGALLPVLVCWIADIEPVMKKIPFIRERFRYPYEDDKRVFVKPVYDL